MSPNFQRPPPLLRLLRRWTPYEKIAPDQPVFVYETRHLPWAASPRHFARRTLLWIGVTWGLVALVLLALAVFSRDGLTADLPYAITAIIASGWLLGFLLDIQTLVGSLGSVRGDVVSGRWELLHLTALTDGEIVLSKHAAVQMRSWRLGVIAFALRTSTVLPALLLIGLMVGVPDVPGARPQVTGADAVLGMVALLGGSLVLGVEGLWRMRAVAALGLLNSARAQDIALSIVSAFGGLMLFYLAGFGIFMAANGCMLSLFASTFGLFLDPYFSSAAFNAPNPLLRLVPAIGVSVLAFALNSAAFYGLYRIFCNAFLRGVARQVLKMREGQ